MSSWRDKIHSGYFYKIGGDPIVAITGKGGAIRYGEALEEQGLPDNFIQECIFITNDTELLTSTKFHPISQITFKTKT
jgi:hypothetical protein